MERYRFAAYQNRPGMCLDLCGAGLVPAGRQFLAKRRAAWYTLGRRERPSRAPAQTIQDHKLVHRAPCQTASHLVYFLLSTTTPSRAPAQMIDKVNPRPSRLSSDSPLAFVSPAPYQLTCAAGAAPSPPHLGRRGRWLLAALQLHHLLTSLILAQDQRWRRA